MASRRKIPLRRRHVQLLSAVVYNLNVKGFADGAIFRGAGKGVCVPGLNCYSCPGAIGACPIGALQASLNNLPALPLYVLGTLVIIGALLGRAVCGFLCPIGLIQDLIDRIPLPKLKKGAWSRCLSWMKYVVLGVFVVALPVFFFTRDGIAVPAFCKWICPAGTLEGGIPLMLANPGLRAQAGGLFWWKIGVLAAVLVASAFIYRPFCRFLCPLGAIYSLMNRFAVLGVRVDEAKCVKCGACVRHCKMDVRKVNDRECIRCGACASVCPCGAIDTRWLRRNNHEEDNAGGRGRDADARAVLRDGPRG